MDKTQCCGSRSCCCPELRRSRSRPEPSFFWLIQPLKNIVRLIVITTKKFEPKVEAGAEGISKARSQSRLKKAGLRNTVKRIRGKNQRYSVTHRVTCSHFL